GTVHFSSTDPLAQLPANYTFTAADKGRHTFSLTFATISSQSVAATDTATSGLTSHTSIHVSVPSWLAGDPVRSVTMDSEGRALVLMQSGTLYWYTPSKGLVWAESHVTHYTDNGSTVVTNNDTLHWFTTAQKQTYLVQSVSTDSQG